MRLNHGPVLNLTDQVVASVALMRDEVGILSVYMGLAAAGVQGPTGEWRIEIKNQLRDLRESARAYGNHPFWAALDRRLQEIEPFLASRADFEEGRGHAFFCGTESGKNIEVRSQSPFPNLVVHGHRAHLIPLIVALDEIRPFGVVALRHDEARVFQFQLHSGRELSRLSLEPDTSDWRELRWQTTSSKSSRPQESDSLRDDFDDRVLANVLRSIEGLAETVRGLAERSKWDVVVLSGDPRLAHGFERSFLSGGSGPALVHSEYVWRYQSPHEIALRATPLAQEARQKKKLDLVSRIANDALAGGPGVVGVESTLKALRSGRVSTLLFDVAKAGNGNDSSRHLEEAVETALELGIEAIAVSGDEARQLEGAGAQLHW